MNLLTRTVSVGRHRGKTPTELRALLLAAEQKAERLNRENDEYACELIRLASEVDKLTSERNQRAAELDTTRIDLGEAREETLRLRVQVQNLTAVDVPVIGHRDVDADDQPTAPIDVRPLWAALKVGPVVTVSNPDAADPAHIPGPSWAKRDEPAEPSEDAA